MCATIEDAHRYLRDGPMAMYERYGFGLWHVARKSDGAAVGMCGLLKRDTLPDVDIGYAYFPVLGTGLRARGGRGHAASRRATSSACDA